MDKLVNTRKSAMFGLILQTWQRFALVQLILVVLFWLVLQNDERDVDVLVDLVQLVILLL